VSDETFISRWSRRKAQATGLADDVAATDVAAPSDGDARAQPAAQDKPTEPVALPPIESLTPESDFTPFMQPNVDAGLKRQALRKLFEDPRFNVMDGLDTYIDDYTKTTPIPEGWLEKMEQVRHLGIFKREEEAPVPPVTSTEEVTASPVGESGVSKG
jgi:hypothetical protein